MQLKLQITKNSTVLFEDGFEVSDAHSFGRAFYETWSKLRQKQFDSETSIGALMEHLDDDVLDQLDGAVIRVTKA